MFFCFSKRLTGTETPLSTDMDLRNSPSFALVLLEPLTSSVLYGVPGGKTLEDSCLYLILIERRKPGGRLSVRESPIKSIRSMKFSIPNLDCSYWGTIFSRSIKPWQPASFSLSPPNRGDWTFGQRNWELSWRGVFFYYHYFLPQFEVVMSHQKNDPSVYLFSHSETSSS